MSVVDRKLELFENIARLRRVGQQTSGSDLAAVRTSLEEELGPAVSQRLAARILGVSHTALQYWVRNGDLPLIYTSRGRREVPVSALLQLRDSVERERGTTAHHRYAMAPTMRKQRQAAKALKGRKDDRSSKSVGNDAHARARARSLAYHQAVARKLRKSQVDEAQHVLYRWRKEGKIDQHYAGQWEEILNQPIREIRRGIVEETQAADDLRQNSPLAGLLSEAERRRIVKEVV